MSWRAAPLGALLVISGCATSVVQDLPPDHPANPAAAVSETPERSMTLAPTAPPAPAASAAPTGGGEHAGHAHHDGGGTTAREPATGTQASYVCPMHPEVVSAKADDRCPKCMMRLKAQTRAPGSATQAAPAAGHEHHNHGGR